MNADEVRRAWAERSGEFSPRYYAHHGPNATSEALLETLREHVDPADPVLELGCSAGRHLAHLHEHGFAALSGIEVNEAAVDVMAETYPELAEAATVHVAAIEDVVGEFPDDRFAAVYSVETLQHIHPDADWVFEALARITGELLVTAETERPAERPGTGAPAVRYVDDDVPLYDRDWPAVFADVGFEQVAVETVGRDTLRAFRPEGEASR